MAARSESHRTIRMPPSRSRQLALAAAHLGLPDSEAAIQNFITAGLLSLAEYDSTFGLALARMAGVDWDDLEKLTRRNGLPA